MSQEIIDAVRDIEREKGIESGTLVAALEDALLAAYKKIPGSSRHATVEIDDQGDFRVFSIELPSDVEERLIEEARERKLEELEALEIETGERSHTLISDDELDVDWSDIPEDQIKREDVTPENFGRIAAQTAKQVILQRIREAERAMMYDEYVDRVSEVVTGIVQQAGDRNNVLVDLGKVEALLPRSEQVDGERYEQGSRIKAVITEVRSGTKGPQVILSRRDPELIKTLFELEVPEIADGLVEIRGVAREPGYRSKIAVESHAQGVDPVGACVGPRGSRVRMVVSELRGEKIDIIPWNPEPARFVAKALSPARVREVYIDDDTKEATVVVPDDQLALAIGKEGLNARLAARLTGWRVDIQSDTEFAQAEADAAYGGGDGEEFSGRCGAILSNGKRCPNEALPGSRYCGLPAHQELALHDSEDTEPVEAEEQPALEIRSDLLAPEAESIGPESVAGIPQDAEIFDSEAPADIAATHGPDATELAATEGEVDLDTVRPEHAEPDQVPAGIAVEPTSEPAAAEATPVDLDIEGRTMETPSQGAAPGEPTAPAVTTEEGTPAA
jgi:transcription termination/antitermination protein NusA